VFFISALGEELGWSGYALDPMQARWGALGAGLLIGLVSAVWHVVPLLQARRPAEWIAWWGIWTVAGRVLIVWLYNNAGKSVFVAAVFHMMTNVTWQLFPVSGSHFDPRVTGMIEALVAATVVAVWGPRTLVRRKIA
jgi:membrane protease YdiL (CAAX protease family)